jgi:hypothetical protein
MDFKKFKKQWEEKGIEVYVQQVTLGNSGLVGHEYWFRKIWPNGWRTTIFYNGCAGWSREDAEQHAMQCVNNPYYMNQIMNEINK